LFCNPFEVYVVAMQGMLTFLTTGAAALLQVPMILGAVQPGREVYCGFDPGPPRPPTLEQRLSAAGVPELSEAFGLEVAETPEVLRRGFIADRPPEIPAR
jgi:hypothetical protein